MHVYDDILILSPHQNSGPCNSFYCLGHFKNVYDDDDDDDDDDDIHCMWFRVSTTLL